MEKEKIKTSKPELLVPAGDFECVRAGVQNGADCIYFGANMFSARASAKNFSSEELKQVIKYCKIRNVKTNLTLNTLITDSEFSDAIEIAKEAYEYGIDAIIVQDLGLARYLIKHFPNIEIHGSTQMSVHNLEGVLELEKLGFKRVVLAREVPINEIEYIRNNCSVDLEMFIHGALCISYSGQCLFSSLIGGRSGNRGKCAQPCRLPYTLLEDNNVIDKGYLLSPRDLCSIEYLPKLINIGINSFKIEGRMKTPEYVATVTRIYRKYIDLAMSDKSYIIDEQDKKDLLQVFNRGGFSSGHLTSSPNKDLIFPEKPNNVGLFLGNIQKYNSNKGHITIKLNESLSIGDSISIDGEEGKYTVSELMQGNNNLKVATNGQVVTIGRMKGNIKPGAKVYKLTSKILFDLCKNSFAQGTENKKIPISCTITIKRNMPIKLRINANNPPFYNNIIINVESDMIPEESINSPIAPERIKNQISKLGNTPYFIETLHIDLDENLHIPSISGLNNLRREAINKLEEAVINNFVKDRNVISTINQIENNKNINNTNIENRKISLSFDNLDINLDYSKLDKVDNIYIPLKFFTNKLYEDKILELSSISNIFITMPTIIKPNYKNLLLNTLNAILSKFNIKGFIVSNISAFILLKDYIDKYNLISNYTMNVFNCNTIKELKDLGIQVVTPSIELNKEPLQHLCNNSLLPVELIVYGRAVLMNCSYCLLGKSNKCYPECKMRCSTNNKYYLKDRLGFKFRIVPDNIQTVTAIYNSKITSIDTSDLNIYSARINILDENIDEINDIIQTVKKGKKLEGNNYTNGNLNREI